MQTIRFSALDSDLVAGLRAGRPDAYGMRAERARATGRGNPCRHCLSDIADGRDMLILAHRPFGALQPYAETGPIFLCAAACPRWSGTGLPPILTTSVDYLLKAYCGRERIVYGTGRVVPRAELAEYAASLLARPEIAFVDVRSARNNCFQCRILRG
ncbi:DUF1203 domain-containing protein [Szabonella alba]|uniref:DUF1203 domain-containing protein n=1 Tax=Szabonella alba TaxID=2804194 RepID=A0A8K0Y0B7_9RHOB|nr:DUF1203 domain-containing protein [Szabonella alba]MBL4918015.1 DUF1203 domain-containing protein [Szabonella alba]